MFKKITSTPLLRKITENLSKYGPSVAKNFNKFLKKNTGNSKIQISENVGIQTPKEIHIHYDYHDHRASSNSERIKESDVNMMSENFFEELFSKKIPVSKGDQTNDYGFNLENIFDLGKSNTSSDNNTLEENR